MLKNERLVINLNDVFIIILWFLVLMEMLLWIVWLFVLLSVVGMLLLFLILLSRKIFNLF